MCTKVPVRYIWYYVLDPHAREKNYHEQIWIWPFWSETGAITALNSNSELQPNRSYYKFCTYRLQQMKLFYVLNINFIFFYTRCYCTYGKFIHFSANSEDVGWKQCCASRSWAFLPRARIVGRHQRIYISDRRDSTPLRLPNICPPNLSPPSALSDSQVGS